jgi:hypothetical protein
MFGRPSTDKLKLRIHDNSYEFAAPSGFEFALAGRVGLPSSKIASLCELSDDALLREAEAIRAVEQRFSDALSGALSEVTSVGGFLKEVDLSLISQDHDWRAIITSLNGMPAAFEEFKKVALVKYMQYLTSRQEAVKTLFAHRQTLRQTPPQRGGGDRTQMARPPPQGDELRETVIFDLTALAKSDKKAVEFARIPKGETVEIALEPDQHLDVLLAKHRCGIELRDNLTFIDDQGGDSVLRTGKTIVGRDTGSDIVIDPRYRDVSRKHLIVETDGDALVRLTDISSHGTSVPPEFLENTSI